MSKVCVLFGVDSVFSAEAVETLRRLNYSTFYGVITGEREWDLAGIDATCDESSIQNDWLSSVVVVPWVTPGLRLDRTLRARKAGFRRFEPVIDPHAVIASTVTLGEGTFVNAGATIGAFARLGAGVTVNRNASIGHHTEIDEFTAIGPGATIAARCRIGNCVQIGTGAAVAPGINIAAHSTVALGAGVIRDVSDAAMVAGTPAQVKRLRS